VVQLYATAGLPAVAASFQAATAMSLALTQANDRARAGLARLAGDGSDDDTADERVVTAALLRDAALARQALPGALASLTDDERGRQEAAMLRALVQLAAGDAEGGLATLGPVPHQVHDSDRVLVHGELALAARRWDEALADFTWARDHMRIEIIPGAAFARFRMAQAHEGAGRPAEAHKAYTDFLAFWRTADRDLPIVIEATRAQARLGS
jgi:hypothetical protein